jgi:hypothetical protein
MAKRFTRVARSDPLDFAWSFVANYPEFPDGCPLLTVGTQYGISVLRSEPRPSEAVKNAPASGRWQAEACPTNASK